MQARVDIRNRKDELDMVATTLITCEKLNLYINKSYLAEIEKKMTRCRRCKVRLIRIFSTTPWRLSV